MPTPPRETIGGLTQMQDILFKQQDPLFATLSDFEELRESEEYTALDEIERSKIDSVYFEISSAYDALQSLIDNF